MTESVLDALDQAIQAMLESPAFKAKSAYERTKQYCGVLTRHGQKIPYWATIRDVIGKGSATDINRGAKDFRIEHAKELGAMPAVPADVPPELAGPLRTLWEQALSAALRTFDAERAKWQADIDAAERAAEVSEAARADAVQQMHDLGEDLASMRAALQTCEQARAEAAALAASAQQAAHEATSQATQLSSALAAERAAHEQQTSDLISRMDGLQRHALKQLDDARLDFNRRYAEVKEDLDEAEAALAAARAALLTHQRAEVALQAECERLRSELARARPPQQLRRLGHHANSPGGETSVRRIKRGSR